MSSDDLEALLDLAMRAARLGGRTLLEPSVVVSAERKGPGDYVTEVDRASERAIAGLRAAEAPEGPVVGEEAGGESGDRYWLVGPLDGTPNYLHRFPAVGVSVALVAAGRPEVGAVHAPFLGETYGAARGRGGRI